MKRGTYSKVNKFSFKTIVETSISWAHTKTYFTLFGFNKVNPHPAVIPTQKMKNRILSKMFPVEKIMIKRPKINENNPPITMVQGTTFFAKNWTKTTKTIEIIDEM
jgi:hypothetical protein